jgi:uncharacterized protein (DUF1501 family)
MKRRTFIKRSAFVGVPLLINGQSIAALASSSMPKPFYDQTDKVLVMIQLDGGNDGLNTLIPLDQYATLYQHRSNIIIPENKLIKLNDEIAFHPAFEGMKNLYDEGRLKIMQNVGYPSPNRSHFRSTDIWTSGSPAEETWTTGWIGRYFDQLYPGFPEEYPNDQFQDPFAITIANRVSETCQGVSANYSMAITDPANLSTLTEGNTDVAPNTPYGFELTFLRNAIAQTNAYGEVVVEASEKGNNLSSLYSDDNELAMQLKTVAKLISGGLKTSIYIVRTGGYDTHANQVEEGSPTSGSHADLLNKLSAAIEAFQDDLQLLGLEERVLGMTFTEFGRQIKSNESLGTDHGEAGPMFLFGACVDPLTLGENPVIPENPDTQEALDYQIDFRNIYASILNDWFSMTEESVQDLLWPDYVKMELLNNCSTTPISDEWLSKDRISLHPNPFIDFIQLQLNGNEEMLVIDLFNNLGQKQTSLYSGIPGYGPLHLNFDLSFLQSGAYYCRITQGQRRKTLKIIRK